PDHADRPEDGVAEASTGLEAGRRQRRERFPADATAAAHQQHVEHREERDAGDDRHDPRAGSEQRALERARLEDGSLEARAGGRRSVDHGCGHRGGIDRVVHRRPLRLDAAPMIASPTTFTSSVIASNTSAAYISTCVSRGPASGKFSASNAASVLAGENSERLSWFELPISIASAMVSPSARPNARTNAPKMPVDAVGSMTRKIASQRVAPMPYAASFSRYGTKRNASWETAATVGTIMMASTSAAGKRPGPLSVVPNSGIQ